MRVSRSALCVHVCQSVCLVCAGVSVGLPFVCMCVSRSAFVCMCDSRSPLCIGRTALYVNVSVGLPCVSVGLPDVWLCVGRYALSVCMCVSRSALSVHVYQSVCLE